MPTPSPWSHILRIADLPGRRPTTFNLTSDEATTRAIATDLDLLGLRKLRFAGELSPMNARDWRLVGQLGATVTQPCIVTLEPVTTRIDEDVARTYASKLAEFIAGSEVEMSEDDSVEQLTKVIDIGALMVEALALALPLYPRADGAELAQAVFTEPGKEALTDDDAKPFAGLKGLRDKLSKGEE